VGVLSHHDDRAALAFIMSSACYETNICLFRLGGCHDAEECSCTYLLLPGDQVVRDNRTLQCRLEINLNSLRHVLLPEFQFPE